MKRLLLAGLVASSLLVAPRPADAGVKNVFKKVGHGLTVVAKTAGELAAMAAAIYVCAAACR